MCHWNFKGGTGCLWSEYIYMSDKRQRDKVEVDLKMFSSCQKSRTHLK